MGGLADVHFAHRADLEVRVRAVDVGEFAEGAHLVEQAGVQHLLEALVDAPGEVFIDESEDGGETVLKAGEAAAWTAGGGIAATVRMTRSESEADLAASALRRLDSLLAEGVTTIEEVLSVTTVHEMEPAPHGTAPVPPA